MWWSIIFANGSELTFYKFTPELYKPVLDKEFIPLLLDETQCDRAYNILQKVKIKKDMNKELFRMLITGALKISMIVPIGK